MGSGPPQLSVQHHLLQPEPDQYGGSPLALPGAAYRYRHRPELRRPGHLRRRLRQRLLVLRPDRPYRRHGPAHQSGRRPRVRRPLPAGVVGRPCLLLGACSLRGCTYRHTSSNQRNKLRHRSGNEFHNSSACGTSDHRQWRGKDCAIGWRKYQPNRYHELYFCHRKQLYRLCQFRHNVGGVDLHPECPRLWQLHDRHRRLLLEQHGALQRHLHAGHHSGAH